MKTRKLRQAVAIALDDQENILLLSIMAEEFLPKDQNVNQEFSEIIGPCTSRYPGYNGSL